MKGIKIKLFVGFLLSIITLVVAFIYAYRSFNSLENSVESLATPDKSIIAFNNILRNLVESDNSMRNYSMTASDAALGDYLYYMTIIDSDLDSVNFIIQTNNSKENIGISELKTMLQTKADLMYALVELKNLPAYQTIASRSMQDIASSITDTSIITAQINQTEIPGIKSSSSLNVNDSNESDKKKLKNLFSKKDKDRTPVPPSVLLQPDTTDEKSSTSSYVLAPNLSIDPQLVYKILSDINKEEKEYNAQLTRQELEIMASDRVIMNKIRSMVDEMQKGYIHTLLQEKEKAQQTATQSSKIIFGLTIVFFMIGLILLAVIINDINVNVRYKNQLEIAKAKAEFYAQNKQQFLANMSHEIRTPLNAISGFTEQLSSSSLNATQKEYLHSIHTASNHLLNLVNDILDVSKIEAGKIALNAEIFNVQKVLTEVVNMLKLQAVVKHIELQLEYDSDTERLIKGDDFRLKQVLLNIISNGIKFTDQGSVSIKCIAHAKERLIDFIFEIADTGIGIAPEKLDEIFNEFSQADTSTTRKYGGTGLGLSISRKIIELQKGTIQVQSTLNKGSVFTIHLTYPIPTKKEIETILKKSDSNAFDLDHCKVLIVDDEPTNLKLADIILKKYSIKAELFNNSQAALSCMKESIFDIAFIDLHMPGMDGNALLNEMYINGFKTFPCIALTADVMMNNKELATQHGFDDILLKPYKEIEFMRMLKKWVAEKIAESAISDTIHPDDEFSNSYIFSLDEVKNFTGNDTNLILEIIRSFIDEHKINLSALYQFFIARDLIGLHSTAHKMLPSYSYMGLSNLVPKLRFLETIDNIDNYQIENELLDILSNSKVALEQLEQFYQKHKTVAA